MTSPRVPPRLTLALALGAVVAAAGAMAAPPKHTVTMEAVRFDPPVVTVKRGDSVTWINRDPYPHNVTAKGAFQSREIAADGKWTYVAAKPGRYDYVCTLHPGMKGTLVVEAR